jgi:methionine sulfoxide reductase heme-binding subunit
VPAVPRLPPPIQTGLLIALLALPGAFMTYRYVQGTTFYGEYLHATGELAARLLILTMAVTPLRLMFANAAWTRWLGGRRRYLGVAAFGYALLHAAAYLLRQDVAVIAREAGELAVATGWVALLVMSALAATSNDAAVRLLGRRWKWLHRAVYAVAALTFAHWILTAFDPVPGAVHLAVLVALEAVRIWKTARLNREVRSA